MYRVITTPGMPLYRYNANGTRTYLGTQSFSSRVTDSRTDTVKRVKPRPVIWSPTSHTVYQKIESSGIWVDKRGTPYDRDVAGCVDTYVGTQSASMPYRDHSARLINDAINEINKDGFFGGLFFAELDKSWGTLGHYAKKARELYRWYDAARKGRLGIQRKRTWAEQKRDWDKGGKLSKEGLAFQYGARPLLQDLDAALQNLVQAASQPQYQKVTKMLVENDIVTKSDKFDSTIPRETFWKQRLVHKLTAYYELNNNQTLADIRRWGFAQPLSLAWEVTPYSFLVDWALPVGDYLSALENSVYIKRSAGTYTRITSQERASVINGSGIFTASFTQTERVVKSVGTPQTPRFKNPLSKEHALNGLMLLSELTRR